MTHADYLTNALTNRKKTICKAVRRLKHLIKFGLKFDAIAFTGLSGSLIAPSIADRLNVGLIAIRKTRDKTHSQWKVESTSDISSYIIIDDLVCGGKTIRGIIKKINNTPYKAICNGLYLYAHSISMHDNKKLVEEICGVNILNGRLTR